MIDISTLARRTAVAVAVTGLTVAAASAASAGTAASAAVSDPVTVTLTVTGPGDTVIHDAEVTTGGKVVSPLTAAPELCDGTNLGANDQPGATPTTALDDSALDWDGVWYASFEDYLVTTIDGIEQTGSEFWLISVNGEATPVGGCQFIVEEGDEVSFSWTDY